MDTTNKLPFRLWRDEGWRAAASRRGNSYPSMSAGRRHLARAERLRAGKVCYALMAWRHFAARGDRSSSAISGTHTLLGDLSRLPLSPLARRKDMCAVAPVIYYISVAPSALKMPGAWRTLGGR